MNPANPLLTDFYQLTMANAYFELGMHETAVFELFVRRLPETRRFLVAAGLEQALEHAERLQFTSADIDFISRIGGFGQPFLDHLAAVRFSGSVHAMAEGTPFFAEEPIVRITAPILEAQLLESRLLNIVHFQTMIASKAVRFVAAARGRTLTDFGLRRAHEGDAGVMAARAAYLSGFQATATVEAGRRFGIPLSGTLAHSFIEAHDQEEAAFSRFVRSRPGSTALLIDTYDIRRGAGRVAALARKLKSESSSPYRIQAVRIDSGELAVEARAVRAILDHEGCPEIQIVLSGGLDEHLVADLTGGDVPVDGFGIGTALTVSADAPSLDMVYKLQEYAGKPRRKRSEGKATWPVAKQVFRRRGPSGEYLADSIVQADETSEGEPLLVEVMRAGRRSIPAPTLTSIQAHCRGEVANLPAELREVRRGTSSYPVSISDRLRISAARLDADA